MEVWRLIVDSPQDGALNMAIDEALLESVGRGDSPPTLRIYRWEPACLSLGYAQSITDTDSRRIAAQGWDTVRRLTGGRAILHVDELTYSVAVPSDHPVIAGSIIESYRRISGALLLALEALGLGANADKRTEKIQREGVGAVCFEVPSDYEITADGKKLVGSAQVRRSDAALQHGSLPLEGDLRRICECLAFRDDMARENAANRVLRRATTLSAALGYTVSWESAAQAVIAGFADTFALAWDQDALSTREQERALELRAARYSDPAWTGRL